MQFYPGFFRSIGEAEYTDTHGLIIGQSGFVEVPQGFEPGIRYKKDSQQRYLKK